MIGMPAPLTNEQLDAMGALAALRMQRSVEVVLSSLPATPGELSPPPSGIPGAAGTFHQEPKQ